MREKGALSVAEVIQAFSQPSTCSSLVSQEARGSVSLTTPVNVTVADQRGPSGGRRRPPPATIDPVKFVR